MLCCQSSQLAGAWQGTSYWFHNALTAFQLTTPMKEGEEEGLWQKLLQKQKLRHGKVLLGGPKDGLANYLEPQDG